MQLAVVAAGFTPGEADKLRRAMASWKRRGGIEKINKKLVQGMLAHGYKREYAEQIYQQIQGFGEYGFPESHAASFALLVYVSSWLKRHEPAAFACALLNSQPLGFYSTSAIVQDAQRHGVEVRPADVQVSDVDSKPKLTRARAGADQPAMRLGLGLVKDLK
jgi:error-prone DNA polymerase